MLDHTTSAKGIKVHLEPGKKQKGWIEIKYGETRREFLENIVNALEEAYGLGEANCREMLAPCKPKQTETWSDNYPPGGSC